MSDTSYKTLLCELRGPDEYFQASEDGPRLGAGYLKRVVYRGNTYEYDANTRSVYLWAEEQRFEPLDTFTEIPTLDGIEDFALDALRKELLTATSQLNYERIARAPRGVIQDRSRRVDVIRRKIKNREEATRSEEERRLLKSNIQRSLDDDPAVKSLTEERLRLLALYREGVAKDIPPSLGVLDGLRARLEGIEREISYRVRALTEPPMFQLNANNSLLGQWPATKIGLAPKPPAPVGDKITLKTLEAMVGDLEKGWTTFEKKVRASDSVTKAEKENIEEFEKLIAKKNADADFKNKLRASAGPPPESSLESVASLLEGILQKKADEQDAKGGKIQRRDTDTLREQRRINDEELLRLEAAKLKVLRQQSIDSAEALRQDRIKSIVALELTIVRLLVCSLCGALTDKYYGAEMSCSPCYFSGYTRSNLPKTREQLVIVVYPDGTEKRMRLTGNKVIADPGVDHPVLSKGRKIRKT